MMILSFVLFIIFIGLAVVHFNWAIGREWGFDSALPTNENGDRILNPRKVDSAIVGIALTCFGLFYLFQLNFFHVHIPSWIFTYGGWIIPSIFLIRVIGDFKYVGFFKKVRNTNFGQMDSKVYSPICAGIGIFGLIIQFLK